MEAFIEEYTDLLVEKIFLLNGVLEATAGLLLILVPHAVFSRVAVSTTATSAARFYGLVVAIFAAVCILVTNVPDEDPTKLVLGTAWFGYHAAIAFLFTVPLFGRLADGVPQAVASFVHVVFAALWAYYLFVANDALPVLKQLLPTKL